MKISKIHIVEISTEKGNQKKIPIKTIKIVSMPINLFYSYLIGCCMLLGTYFICDTFFSPKKPKTEFKKTDWGFTLRYYGKKDTIQVYFLDVMELNNHAQVTIFQNREKPIHLYK